ncbi:MAG: hypothetical protein QOG03_2174 [Actinomycetota bacterium]|jgi:hypothetical protein|nr:hypothetical protein [Actinomycetota bacterium]
MRRALALLAVLLVGLVVPMLHPVAASADTGSDEAAFVAKINQLRASKGLGQLQVDGQLVGIARNWAGRMSSAGRISHNPNLASQVTENWIKLGENVGHGTDVDSLFRAFVNSPEHYRNLVDPAFNYVGVGVVRAGDGSMYTSHEFMQLAGSTARVSAPAPAPRPVVSRTISARPATTTAAARPAPAKANPVVVAAPPAPPVPTALLINSLEELRGKGAGV